MNISICCERNGQTLLFNKMNWSFRRKVLSRRKCATGNESFHVGIYRLLVLGRSIPFRRFPL